MPGTGALEGKCSLWQGKVEGSVRDMEILDFSETLDMGTVGQIWGWWGR